MAERANIMNYNGAIVLAGNSRSVRVDHCNFRANRDTGAIMIMSIAGAVCGVADHNVIKNPGDELCAFIMGHLADRWNSGANGDGAFAAPTNFGGPEFFC